MRWGLVVVGIILIVLGGVLMYVPLVPEASVHIDPSSPYYATLSGYSPTGKIPGSVSWTSPSSTEVVLQACTGQVSLFECNGTETTTFENGTSGSFSFSVPQGGSIILYTEGNASANVKLAEPTYGAAVLGVGVILLVLGLVLRRRASGAPPAPPSSTPPTE
jgi:uncharacterized membrane protein